MAHSSTKHRVSSKKQVHRATSVSKKTKGRRQTALQATVAALSLSCVQLLSPVHAKAADPVPITPKYWEKCYGIARAFMNDCSSLDGAHHCSGGARVDSDPKEYVWVPRNTCRKIVGGSTYGIKRRPARKVKCEPSSTSRKPQR